MPNPLVTTDATTTTLVTYAPPRSATGALDSFAVWDFNLSATTGTVCATWSLRAAAKRVSGTTSLVGTLTTLSSHKDAGAAAWTVSADVNAGNVRLRVTGAAATTITWLLQGPRQCMTGTGAVPLWTEAA